MEQEITTLEPQLTCELRNHRDHDKNTIYITTDSTYNQLSLRITTNVEATFKPASHHVPPDQGGSADGSMLYLDLSSLNLSTSEFQKLEASAAEWSFQAYPDQRTIGMTPTVLQTLKPGPGNQIDITLASLTLSSPPQGSVVYPVVTYFHVPSITDDEIGQFDTLSATLQVPPDTHKRELQRDIQLSTDTNAIITSDEEHTVANFFTLAFGPGPEGKEVKAGPATAFVLTFVYGTGYGYGALTDIQHARDIKVTRGLNADEWHIESDTTLQNPSWKLTPPVGKPIIGTGPQSNVAFDVTNIVTLFRAGPTSLLLTYQGIPGYQDGSFILPLYKIPHVQISSLQVEPNPTYLTEQKAEVTVRWQTKNATSLFLAPLCQDVTNLTSIPAEIFTTTPFTLTAKGPYADRNNVAYRTVEAVVLPRINSFTASPRSIYYKDFPCDVTFSWAVDSNERIKLVSSREGTGGDTYEPIGSVTKSIQQPQMMTLIPISQHQETVQNRKLVLSAFKTQHQRYPLAQKARLVAASPTAPLTALAHERQISFIDNALYQPIGEPLATGDTPHLAFAPDGSFVFVASGDGQLTLIHIQETQTRPYYTFQPAALPDVSDKPTAVAISRDAKTLFVTTQDAHRAGKLIILVQEGNTYHKQGEVAVGKEPTDIALDPSGARVYVSNAGENTISIIGVDAKRNYALTSTVGNIGQQPRGLGITRDGQILLVASADGVFALSTSYPDGSPRQHLPVETPVSFAMMAGGRYAFVSLEKKNALALIACGTLPKDCKVLEENIQVGEKPTGVTVTLDDGLVLVTNTGDASMSVLTLATYEAETTSIPSVEKPTGVVVTPDAKQVYSWHNALIRDILHPKDIPGLSVHDRISGISMIHLETTNLITCAVHPDKNRQFAFALEKASTDLLLIDTGTFETQRVPLEGGHQPLLLDVSANGERLFLLCDDKQRYYMQVFDITGQTPKKLAEKELYEHPSTKGFKSLCVLADGSQAFVTESSVPLLHQIYYEEGSYQVKSHELEGRPEALTALPDGARLYVFSVKDTDPGADANMNMISVINPRTMHIRTVHLGIEQKVASIQYVVPSPDGTALFATDASGVRIVDPVSLRLSRTYLWPGATVISYGIATQPDGAEIFVTDRGGSTVFVLRQVQPE
uniref:Uncharacterized protein n=1 Tax=Thermosporothrix sp. COM3 TaxID=2490863 RepID=A0A455SS62_9CHLR|nr:hypothetical protein KTC_27550 [Thermosporothrix sp. COM3]